MAKPRKLAHGGTSEGLELAPGIAPADAAFLRELGLGHTVVRPDGAPMPDPAYRDYSREPARAPVLIVNKAQPYNAEPSLSDLAATGFITPDKVRWPCTPRSARCPSTSSPARFFSHALLGQTAGRTRADGLWGAFSACRQYFLDRSHGPIPLYPDVSRDWALVVDGLVGTPLSLTLAELQNGFPKVSVAATIQVRHRSHTRSLSRTPALAHADTLPPRRVFFAAIWSAAQCAGNRRNDFTRKVRKVRGVGWEAGALSTGVFSGARLRDVLQKASVLASARHVAFEVRTRPTPASVAERTLKKRGRHSSRALCLRALVVCTRPNTQGDDNCIEDMFGMTYYFKYQASVSVYKAMYGPRARGREPTNPAPRCLPT